MAGYWPRVFFLIFIYLFIYLFLGVFMDRDIGQYPAIFTEQAWSIKDLLYGQKIIHQIISLFREQSGKSRAGKIGPFAQTAT